MRKVLLRGFVALILLPALLLLSACGEAGETLNTAIEVLDAVAAVSEAIEAADDAAREHLPAPEISAHAPPQKIETPEKPVQSEKTPEPETTEVPEPIDEFGAYTTAQDVALYIHTYGRLPGNFMTKAAARDLGWEGGSLEKFAPGMCIGGDRFGNYEGLLPKGHYTECDIDTMGASSRGAKRIVFSDDGRIYYTEDHYSTFKQLY